MRLQSTILLITTIIFSCTKSKSPQQVKNKNIISCDFGIKEFNTTKKYFPLDSVPFLEKRPRPKNPSGVILLDFNGGDVNNSIWGAFQVGASGMPNNSIQQVFDNCLFDFNAFNVYVTTDETYYNQFDGKKTRCFITETYQWYGNGAGGVAQINSFNYIYEESVCFVFSLLLNYNTKFIQEAVSHEIGHTLGLYHVNKFDTLCNYISEYDGGCCGTAKIMGIGYYQPNVIWHGTTNPCTPDRNDSLYIKNLVGSR